MQKFVDHSGRIWVVQIDVATIKRVRSVTGVDLLSIVEGELIEQLSRDPVLLCDVLYAVCQPQALAADVSEETFGEGLAGDAIAEATVALLEALVAFFPEPRRRLLQQAASKYQAIEQQALKLLSQRLDDPQLEKKALAEFEQRLTTELSSD
ncbi:hypothetical protein SH139x_001959 [Planctomycetaceae bacterium SH139]